MRQDAFIPRSTIRCQGKSEKKLEYLNGSYCAWRIAQSVIPAKSVCGGREPGSRQNLIILDSHWIPDLAPRSGARPE